MLAGRGDGGGAADTVLLHGVTATRRYVVHGSKVLSRARAIVSSPTTPAATVAPIPAPPEGGYSYPELVADLEAVVDADRWGSGRSCSAATRWAPTPPSPTRSRHAERLAGLVVIGPAYTGFVDDEATRRLGSPRRRARARRGRRLHGGVRPRARPRVARRVLRFTRQRMSEHLHPDGGRTSPARGTALAAVRLDVGARVHSTSRRWSSRVATPRIPAIRTRSPPRTRRPSPRRAWSPRRRVRRRWPGRAGALARASRASCDAAAVRLAPRAADGPGPGPMLAIDDRRRPRDSLFRGCSRARPSTARTGSRSEPWTV